jgi:hypothetical protein
MIAAVHTRRIVDPIVGLKFTGSAGRLSFGTLNASDQAAGRSLDELDPRRGDDRVFNVGRVRYSLGTDRFAGALIADTRFGADRNTVGGADVSWRIGGGQHFTMMALHSWTEVAAGARSGAATQMNYSADSSRVNFGAQLEHYDRDFSMETAFYNRTGFTSAWTYLGVNFYPDKTRYPWIRRIVPFTFTQGGRDRMAGADDILNVSGFRFNFTRQGFFRIDWFFGREPWAGRRFDIRRMRTLGEVQLFPWLYVDGYRHAGRSIFYDPENPFAGEESRTAAGITFQPTGRLTQRVEYTRVVFDRAEGGERVYDIDILNTRTTYQFTRTFSLRGIAQYDSSQRRVLTDFLSSYELRPGTVIYGGYGALFEQRDYREDQWLPGSGPYRNTRRGLFFKASYLYRF